MRVSAVPCFVYNLEFSLLNFVSLMTMTWSLMLKLHISCCEFGPKINGLYGFSMSSFFPVPRVEAQIAQFRFADLSLFWFAF